MQVRSWKNITATLAGLLFLSALPARSQAHMSTPDVPESRIDLYAGYSYLHPYQADINKFFYQDIKLGAELSVAAYFNKYIGIQAEGGLHPSGPNDCIYTAQAGPIARYQVHRFVPFAHALGGGAKVGGPVFQPCTWGYGFTGGVGFDYVLPGFSDHFAVRPIQADYNYNHVDFGPLLIPGGYAGGLAKMDTINFSAGLVYRIGGTLERLAAALSCLAAPGSVFAGEPVTINSNTVGLSPKRKTTYMWTATGGTISGSGDTIQIATDGLQPGSYTAKGSVIQGGKAYQQATCAADFTVKVIEPPTLSCSADPSSVHPGDSTTITATAVSPQNRPLTYSYASSAGQITGSTATATLSSAGALAGEIVVSCNVVDDKGQTATAKASVQVMPIPVAAAPSTRALCSIGFVRDRKRPVRVDNEAKGCLDDIALTLQRDSDSKLVMVGNDATGETTEMAAERASNAKLYLTKEKGLDANRIMLRTGSAGDKSVTDTLVPAGATFDETGSAAVIESAVQHHGQAYGVAKPKPVKKSRR